ncbi:MAG: hypothetical protein HY720_19865 [Planctomycetes bacterium]|nr:hypothetical protein [Planctomycetota bacterium]
MTRPRQARLELTPLLDVVFQILIFFIASLVARGKEEHAALSEKEKELLAEAADLRELSADDRRERFEAEQDLSEERSKGGRLVADLDEVKRQFQDLARQAGAQEELLKEIEKRFGERAAETAVLLATIERNFDLYEINFYADRRVRFVTPKKEQVEATAVTVEDVWRFLDSSLPADFETVRSVFLVRRERGVSWIHLDADFYPAARQRKWIVNDKPVDIN